MDEVYVPIDSIMSWVTFVLITVFTAYLMYGVTMMLAALADKGGIVLKLLRVYVLGGMLAGSVLYSVHLVTKDTLLSRTPEEAMIISVKRQFSLDPDTTDLYADLDEYGQEEALAASVEVDDDDTLYIIRNGKRCEYNYVHVPSTVDSEGNVTLTPANGKCVHEHRGS